MAKIARPLYPESIEREYYRFLARYAAAYIALMRQGIAEILPELRQVSATEQPQIRQDANIEKKIGQLFEWVNGKLAVRFTDEALKKAAKAMVVRSSKHSRTQATKMLNSAKKTGQPDINVDQIMHDKGMAEYFQNVVDENVGLIKSIPLNRQNALKVQLVALITKDARVEDIQSAIQRNFKLTKGRALTIARDQVGKLSGALDKYRQQQLGLKRYRWRTSDDARVRKDHARLDGKVYYWSKPPVINRSTGLRGNPKDDINCRCWAEPILDDILV